MVIVEQLGAMVRNFEVGDRIVIPSAIACGSCSYCRVGDFAQCDNANPAGKQARTAFFRRPHRERRLQWDAGRKGRVPFANAGLVKLPDELDQGRACAGKGR